MKQNNRRQWVLLGVAGVALFLYFRYSGVTFSSSGAEIESLPPIEAKGLENRLKSISTVNPDLIVPLTTDSDPDRNLFQYGERRPPPPDPAEVERMRVEAQKALEVQEKAARAQKEQEALVAAAAAAAAAANPPPPVEPQPPSPPPPPPRPEPPVPTFKFVGIMGPAHKKVAAFIQGDKMLLAKKGDIIEGKFKVLEIGVEWAELGYTDPAFKDRTKRIYFGT